VSVLRTRYVEYGHAFRVVYCSRLQRFVRLALRSQQLALSNNPLPTEDAGRHLCASADDDVRAAAPNV
jgi:hypothetical protein